MYVWKIHVFIIIIIIIHAELYKDEKWNILTFDFN